MRPRPAPLGRFIRPRALIWAVAVIIIATVVSEFTRHRDEQRRQAVVAAVEDLVHALLDEQTPPARISVVTAIRPGFTMRLLETLETRDDWTIAARTLEPASETDGATHLVTIDTPEGPVLRLRCLDDARADHTRIVGYELVLPTTAAPHPDTLTIPPDTLRCAAIVRPSQERTDRCRTGTRRRPTHA